MKKSEYLDLAAAFAEQAGVAWDPEEPALPERLAVFLHVDRPAYLAPENHDGVGQPGRLEEAQILHEAAARYNALERLFRGALIPLPPSELPILRRMIAEERDKLYRGAA